MARNIDIFQTKAQGQYIYQQYQKLEWLKKYAKFIDEYIQKNYFDKLKSMWETMDVGESLDPYLTFYTKWLFGLYRPLASASMSEFYDIGRLYDNDVIFDDAQEADGLVSGEDYLKYIKFIYDYTQETWHIDHIIAFVADYCKINPTDIYVDYSNKTMIKIKIPSSATTGADFIKLTINYYDAMCLPFPNVLDFVLMQETDDFWRGIIYTLYGLNNHFPNITTDKNIAKQYDVETILHKTDDKEYKITEKRTYQCIKVDKSISLEQVEPQHLKDENYWKLKQYNKGVYVYIPKKSAIITDPENKTPLYEAGLYQCIKDDLDVEFEPVFYYNNIPTEYPKSTGVPLCFDKYVDVSNDNKTERISAWATKWKQIYTQQEIDIIYKHGLDDLSEFNEAYPIDFKFNE